MIFLSQLQLRAPVPDGLLQLRAARLQVSDISLRSMSVPGTSLAVRIVHVGTKQYHVMAKHTNERANKQANTQIKSSYY